MLISLLFWVVPVSALKGIHLGSGRVLQWEDAYADPSPIERLRLGISKIVADGAKDPVTVHILRLRWTSPHAWNDNGAEDGRSFSIVCEAEDGGTNESLSLIDMSISSDITAVHERFVLPDTPLSIICAVRAVNSEERKSKWKYSKLILLGTNLTATEEKKPQTQPEEGQSNDTPQVPTKTKTDPMDLKKLLSLSEKKEIPFPQWKKRPALSLEGREIAAESENSTKSPSTEETSPAPTETTTATDPSTTEVSLNDQEIMNLLKESEITPIDPLGTQEAPPKADQIIREPDLFLRGLSLKTSDLPKEESRERSSQGLPFRTGAFDFFGLSHSKLSQQEKDDYDLLESRLREAIGSPNLERVL